MILKRLLLAAGILAVLLAPAVWAAPTCTDLVFSVDVPTSLTTFTLQAYQAVQCASNAYKNSPLYFSGAGLNSRVNVISLAWLPAPANGKKFIFTTDAPFSITPGAFATCNPCSYTQRDIVQAECSSCTSSGSPTWNYTPYIPADFTALPSATVIDSLAVDSDGNLLVSFDAPTKPTPPGATTYALNDVVKMTNTAAVRAGATATYAMKLSHTELSLSASTNIVGFDLSDVDYFFMFGAPFSIGGNSFRSGYGYRRAKTSFGPPVSNPPFFSDPAYPSGSIGTDFLLSDPTLSHFNAVGEVQNLNSTTLKGIQVSKSGANLLLLSWNAECTGNATGYDVYEGTMAGGWTTYIPVVCNVAGTSTTITPGPGNTFYLVVPVGGAIEGSYGRNSSNQERPASTSACVPIKKIGSCP